MKKIAFIGILLSITHLANAQCPFNPTINESSTIICQGDTISLSTQTYDSYQWYLSFSSSNIGSPISGETNQTLEVTDFGYYTVVCTLGTCIDTSNTILVDMYAFLNPGVISSGQSDFCQGDSTMIEITFGSWTNIQWYKDFVPIPGANSNQFWVTETGSYHVTASPASCPNTTLSSGIGVSFTFHTPVVPTISWDGTILTSSVASGYLWNLNGNPISGANSQSYTPSTSGDYHVITQDNNGCIAGSDTLTIVVCNNSPTINELNTTICPGDSIVLSTQAYDNYQWYYSSTSSSIGSPLTGETNQSLTLDTEGYYTVEITSNGCVEISNTVFIGTYTFNDPIILGSSPFNYCTGDSIMLEIDSPGSWSTFQWFENGTLLNGANSDNYWVSSSGSYSVTTNPVECPNLSFNSGDVQVIENTPIVPTITWDGTILTSSVANTYQWNLDNSLINGATNQTYTPISNGAYSVTTTDSNGCEATSDTVNVLLVVDGILENSTPTINYGSNWIQVSSNEKIESINLFSTNGMIVRTIKPTTEKIELTDISKGVYILTVQTKEKSYSQKISIR